MKVMAIHAYETDMERLLVYPSVNPDILTAEIDQAVPLGPQDVDLNRAQAALACEDNIALVGMQLAAASASDERPELDIKNWRLPYVGRNVIAGAEAVRNLHAVPVVLDDETLAARVATGSATVSREHTRRFALVGTIVVAGGLTVPRALDVIAGIKLPEDPADTRQLFLSAPSTGRGRYRPLATISPTVARLQQAD